jgi:hypothetical protein
MGYGATRTLERVAAAIGMLDGAPIEFEQVQDVPDGGVLFALPALLENGLLSGTDKIFTMPEGFYPIETIFLLLALMALARIPSLEGLRYVIAGEWGKLLGLDRIPEVRTLRQKREPTLLARGPGRTLEQSTGPTMDGRLAAERRSLLCRRSCEALSWQTYFVAPALRCAGAALSARHHRLLG